MFDITNKPSKESPKFLWINPVKSCHLLLSVFGQILRNRIVFETTNPKTVKFVVNYVAYRANQLCPTISVNSCLAESLYIFKFHIKQEIGIADVECTSVFTSIYTFKIFEAIYVFQTLKSRKIAEFQFDWVIDLYSSLIFYSNFKWKHYHHIYFFVNFFSCS